MSIPPDGDTVSRSAANKAGRILRTADMSTAAEREEYQHAIEIAQLWRAQHIEATQQCFSTILEHTEGIPNAVCTYRLKRLTSIIRKLQRPNAHLKLGELDDIGGCRLIVESNEQVSHMARLLKTLLPLKNGGGEKNYIDSPQRSGYRSHHLLTKLDTGEGSYQVEIQIRTRLQHYWSTAVEAAGEIYGVEYKSPQTWRSATGDDEERIRFFKIVSGLFAAEEGTAPVPGFEQERDALLVQLRSLACATQLLDDLQASTDSVLPIPHPSHDHDALFLLKLSREDQYLDIEAFPQDRLAEALERYGQLEELIEARAIGHTPNEPDGCPYDNVVLVHATDSNQLEIAYPNYSTNVDQFVSKVHDYLRI